MTNAFEKLKKDAGISGNYEGSDLEKAYKQWKIKRSNIPCTSSEATSTLDCKK